MSKRSKAKKLAAKLKRAEAEALRPKKATKAIRIEGQLLHALDSAELHGFKVRILCATTPIHYRFTRAKTRIDFWPATGRFMVLKRGCRAEKGDIADAMSRIDGAYEGDGDELYPEGAIEHMRSI